MERVMGIEPTSSAWKAEVLPLNYTRLDSLCLQANRNLRQTSQFLCAKKAGMLNEAIRRAHRGGPAWFFYRSVGIGAHNAAET